MSGVRAHALLVRSLYNAKVNNVCSGGVPIATRCFRGGVGALLCMLSAKIWYCISSWLYRASVGVIPFNTPLVRVCLAVKDSLGLLCSLHMNTL